MARAIWFLFKTALLVAAAVWLARQPGTVEATLGGYALRSSPGFLAAALLAFLALYTLALRLWRGLADMPRLYGRYSADRRRERGYGDVTAGFIAVAAGDAEAAARHAARAQKNLPAAPLARLLTAQAHLLHGEAPQARAVFAALAADGHGAFLGLKGLLQEMLRAGDHAQALTCARRADRAQPGSGWVLKTLFDLETRARNWDRAEKALNRGARKNAFSPAAARRHRQALFLARADDANRAGDAGAAWKLARKAFMMDPAFAPAALELCRFYAAAGRRKDLPRTIETAWRAGPHPALGALWMQEAPAPAKKTRTPYAEGQDICDWAGTLRARNPRHPESARLMGQAAMAARRWHEARRFLAQAQDYRLLARLERLDGGDEAKAREWLETAAENPPQPQWVCDACGHAAAAWGLFCGHCGVFDGYAWTLPGAPRGKTAAEGQDLLLPSAGSAP